MSIGIQISLPLELLSGAESLTAEGISAYLSDAVKAQQKIQQADMNIRVSRERIIEWARDLEKIVDSDLDDFRKVQALRQLVAASREYANQVEGIMSR